MASNVKLTKAQRATLMRLASGDSIAYSQDGDDGWFTKGDRARVGNEVISLRAKGLIERRIDPSDETDNYRGMAERDVITPAGLEALREVEGR